MRKVNYYLDKYEKEVNRYASEEIHSGDAEEDIICAEETFSEWCNNAEAIVGSYFHFNNNVESAIEEFEKDFEDMDVDLRNEVKKMLYEVK